MVLYVKQSITAPRGIAIACMPLALALRYDVGAVLSVSEYLRVIGRTRRTSRKSHGIVWKMGEGPSEAIQNALLSRYQVGDTLSGAGKDDMLPAVEAYRARRESFGSELTYNEAVKLLSFGRRDTTVNELADEDGITRASLRESKAGHTGTTFCTGLHPTRYTGHICGDAKKARGDHEPGCFDPAGVRRGARG